MRRRSVKGVVECIPPLLPAGSDVIGQKRNRDTGDLAEDTNKTSTKCGGGNGRKKIRCS